MAYQSRKRNYKTSRERYKTHMRHMRVTAAFATAALLLIIFFNRQSIWDWLRTYFM